MSDRSPPRRSVLAEALRRCRGTFATVGLFSFCMNLLVLAGPLYMLQVYDRVLSSGRVETLIMLTLILAVALMTWAALEQLRTALTVRLGAWFTQVLGPHYIESSVRARLDGYNPGSQAFRDLGQVQSFVATNGMSAFFDIPWTPLFVAVIWLLHPWLGMFALTAVILLLVVTVINELSTRTLLKEANESNLAATQLVDATVRNAEPVSAMGLGPALIERWMRMNAAGQNVLLAASGRTAIATGTAKFLRMFFQSTALGLGAFLAIRGELSPGVMIAGSIMLGRALAPIDVAMGAWKSFSGARLAYDRLKTHAEAYPPARRRLSMPRPRGGLTVDGVTVVSEGRTVLRRVSFSADPGEAIAVIGPSAAGKSTLCKAIVGLVPLRTGAISLDGVEMRLWNTDELGPYIGYLPQEVGLFGASVRENIARMGEAEDDAVIDAAELAHAHEMIVRMSNGYETQIGDGGSSLSGGQRQRIGLARAVFGRPPLIVLDEPNAHLDQAGEAALADAIFELKRCGSTLLIVGHRPSTLAQADKVLLLRDGAVQAFGPRNEVLDKMRQAAQNQAGNVRQRTKAAAQPNLSDEAAPPDDGGDGDVASDTALRLQAEQAGNGGDNAGR
jgi:PrtD family type I secretion system ABC transporter